MKGVCTTQSLSKIIFQIRQNPGFLGDCFEPGTWDWKDSLDSTTDMMCFYSFVPENHKDFQGYQPTGQSQSFSQIPWICCNLSEAGAKAEQVECDGDGVTLNAWPSLSLLLGGWPWASYLPRCVSVLLYKTGVSYGLPGVLGGLSGSKRVKGVINSKVLYKWVTTLCMINYL